MTDAITAHLPRLHALAYRMLGSVADAEDAVQETALRWQRARCDEITNDEAWLVRVCTRVAIDQLRRRKREAYTGAWLPEPLAEDHSHVPALAESLRLAFLLILERLSPKERAAFLLHDVFDTPYEEIAEALSSNPAACRQHVARARRRLADDHPRFDVPPRAELDLMTRFGAAVADGDMDRVMALLAPEAQLISDGGGKATAALNILRGPEAIARFIVGLARKYGQALEPVLTSLNGAPALILSERRVPIGVWSAETDGSRITALFSQRNPDKLARLAIH